eukprot:CAMPEP_0116859594 /NCGR_PEP_ID=MMETSP0418-20121206/21912_1 /TAXON_ID=1158023 /ORGANISM="Astrosyne radiata, Strain 13vi08-1A" /LENGTH=57 /DNA_ID=CAMNT_0004493839 /DNA_START=1 /DNA_END=170 /DNA_ORIENTATION=+
MEAAAMAPAIAEAPSPRAQVEPLSFTWKAASVTDARVNEHVMTTASEASHELVPAAA